MGGLRVKELAGPGLPGDGCPQTQKTNMTRRPTRRKHADTHRLGHARAQPCQEPPLRVQLSVGPGEHGLFFGVVFVGGGVIGLGAAGLPANQQPTRPPTQTTKILPTWNAALVPKRSAYLVKRWTEKGVTPFHSACTC